jgi:hypothetical protein
MPIDHEKDTLEIVRHELDYRRKKQWDIFQWSVTMLLAVIGGTVALVGNGNFKFAAPLRAIMAGAVAVIAYYAVKWIDNNSRFEDAARSKLLDLLKSAALENAVPSPRDSEFGYTTTVALVAFGAVLTVLIAPIKDWCAALACLG